MEIRIRRTTGGHVWFSFTACLLVMLSVVSTSRAALTANEKAALGQILTAYPDLMIVPPWASTTADGKYHGKAWSFGFDAVCNSPGYDLYGIHCSDQGHVDGLEVYAIWNCFGIVQIVHFKFLTVNHGSETLFGELPLFRSMTT